MRKAFSFYRSHYEQMKLLNKTQTADLMIGICEVQFLEVNIDDISFKDKMTQLVWTGIKHGIKASVDGYISKKGINPTPLARGLARGSENVLNPLEQGEEKEKEKEKEKEEVQYVESVKKWIDYRKSIKKPLAPHSIEAIIKKHSLDATAFEASVNYSIENGYQGLFEPKQQKSVNNQKTTGDVIDDYFNKQIQGEIIDAEIN